jgi:CDP-6-deoxy-D-xylo-4-hexulose-3-dehydrase
MIGYNSYSWPLMQDTMTWCDRFKLAKFVMTADRFTQGKKVEEFEQAWSDWLGVKYSLFVTSGSTANFLLLDAVKEMYFKNKKKIKVLVPACTWVTNVNPVFQLGMEPVFCDINLDNYSFDIESMEKIAKTHKIDIVFITHLLGMPAPVVALRDIFPKAIFIEDVCESHGAEDTLGYKVGTKSSGSTFSFYFGHHMSTIEGGMVSTNDVGLYTLMKMKRSHGMSRVVENPQVFNELFPDIDPQFLFMTAGYNFRNTELGAVLGLSQLKKLDGFIEQRRKNFEEYMDIMSNHKHKFHVPYNDEGNSSFCFPLIAKTPYIKDQVLRRLKVNRIEYRPVVGGNLLRQPYLSKYNTIKCSNADVLHENGIYIGNNQFVGDKELNLLEQIIRSL